MVPRAALVLGTLLVATVGAAVATQRLRHEPALVRRLHVTPTFTPNGDGWRDRATVRFMVGRADVVTVAVLDRRGRVVRTLAAARSWPARRFLRLRWDGRTAKARPAPDGVYRVRVTLPRRGHELVLRDAIRLHRVAPHGSRAR